MLRLLPFILATAQAAAGVLPYPGKVVSGEFATADGRSCTLLFWHGRALDRQLLKQSERQQLDAVLDETRRRWLQADRREQARLVSRYLQFSMPAGKHHLNVLLFRGITYQHLRVACGEAEVRAGFVLFPQLAGQALMVYYPPTQAFIVFVDYAPRAKEVAAEVAEDIEALVKAYRDDLERATSEEELPRPLREAAADFRKAQQRKEKGRIRFADFNGIYLPNCPGQCPPGTLAEAWSRLASEERRAFAPLLGLLAKAGEDPGSIAAPGVFLHGTAAAWPEEFGDNPVDLKELTKELLPLGQKTSFSRPDPALARELFGRDDWEPPQLDGPLKEVLKAMRKALR